ncbi:MAG: hypothetical protein RLZZ136_495 [Pseudomonadota bacterium]
MSSSLPTLNCGFIGLGDQGAPIAWRMIEAGFPTRLWARREASLAPFATSGATVARDIAELGATCAHIGICVVDDAGVAEVCAKLIPAMAQGSVIAIHSTVSAALCQQLAIKAAERKIILIDAPVSGGAPAAKTGTLTVMVGGSADGFAKARPVLASFGGLIVHLGDVGAGQCAKLINNTLLAANLTATQNALDAGGALGLDRGAMAKLLKVSTGGSYALGIVANLPGLGAFAHGGALLRKDADLLVQLLPSNVALNALRNAAIPFLEAVNKAAKVTN